MRVGTASPNFSLARQADQGASGIHQRPTLEDGAQEAASFGHDEPLTGYEIDCNRRYA